MSDYTVEIDGTYDLDQINASIAGEEAGASEFKSSVVVSSSGKTTNIATFSTLPAGTVPKALTVVNQTEPQPSGTVSTWSGTMLVKGTSTAVHAYRKS
jgi:hypothetical protein